jgi:prefoldin subunit 5
MKKTEVPGIYKVGEGILINKDENALKAYKLRKERESRFHKVEENLDTLSSEIREIKELLKGLVR